MTAAAAGTRSTLLAVGPDVYAYTQLPGGWCVSNAGVIVGEDGVVVVDTLATRSRARRLREAVDGLNAGPTRTVVNTHHHGDHVFGNAEIGADAPVEIIAHDRMPGELADTGLALTRLWPDVDWGDVRLSGPTITFSDRMSLVRGGRIIELLHVGPAHTTNDVVVWLPAERVLFAGDVVLSGSTPFVLMGSVEGSLTAIERLALLRADVVVCGHGPVTGPEVFEQNIAYLRWLQRYARQAHSAGISPLDAARHADLGPFADLLDPERIVGNLHRAYAELDGAAPGAAIDVAPVFGEMIRYNGGRLPDCLA